jgi:hypothetical protein
MDKDIKSDDWIVSGGLWFSDEGFYYIIKDSFGVTATAPLRALASFVKSVLPHEAGVRDWIERNPPNKTGDAEKDAQEAEMWWKKLCVVMIDNGWNVAWNGNIHTNNPDAKSLTKALKNVPQTVFENGQFNWPEDTIVTVKNLEDEQYKMRLGTLLGKETNTESMEPTAVAPEAMNPAIRLQKLKSLLDQNLISEVEYNSKKTEILSQL